MFGGSDEIVGYNDDGTPKFAMGTTNTRNVSYFIKPRGIYSRRTCSCVYEYLR
jgi:hypothetical protein